MKSFYSTLLLLSFLLVAGCNDTPFVDEESTGTQQTFTLSASMPGSGDPNTRVTAGQLPDSKDIALKWKEGDKIQLYFKSGNVITQGDEVEVQNISTNGKKADFTVEVPAGISGGFDLYGVHGTTSEATAVGAILLDATPGSFVKLEDAKVPLFFKQENVDPASPGQSVTFQHFGALQVITLRNTVNENITLGNPSLVFSGVKWYHDAIDNKYPLYDIVSGEPTTKAGSSPSSSQPFTVEIAYNENVKLAQWVMPNGKNPPAIQFKVEKGGTEYTTSAKDAREEPLETGHAYHLYALWNGSGLTFANEADVQAYKITMTTSKSVGSTISLYINAAEEDKSGVWIDMNKDGFKNDGEDVNAFGSIETYTVNSRTVTLYGKVNYLDCSMDSLTALDVSNNTALTGLNCFYNSLAALDVSNNTALFSLDCSSNSLDSLDLSKNTALTNLYCSGNSLTALDVSKNTALVNLYCFDNFLEALDVSHNKALYYLACCKNKINGNAMDTLVNSLPDRIEKSQGQFRVIDLYKNPPIEENVCTKPQVNIATGKNWYVKDSRLLPYEGSDE